MEKINTRSCLNKYSFTVLTTVGMTKGLKVNTGDKSYSCDFQTW